MRERESERAHKLSGVSCYTDTNHIGSGPHPMTSLHPLTSLEAIPSPNSATLGLSFQQRNFGGNTHAVYDTSM